MAKKQKATGPNNAGQATRVYDHRSSGEPVKTKRQDTKPKSDGNE